MISRESIEALAVLARITVTPEEAESIAKDADAILAYVSEVGGEASLGEGDAHTALVNRMRDDGEPHDPGLYTEAILADAPAVKRGYLEVRKVITKE